MFLSVVLVGKSEGVSLDREIVLDNTEREKGINFCWKVEEIIYWV